MLLDSFALSASDSLSQAGLLAVVVLGLETLFRIWTDHWNTEYSSCFTIPLHTADPWHYGIQAIEWLNILQNKVKMGLQLIIYS